MRNDCGAVASSSSAGARRVSPGSVRYAPSPGVIRSSMAALTDREREVAVAVGRGLSNAEISAELFMSVPTVKTHVGRLFTKLDVDNRVQLAILVHDAAE